MLNLSRLIKLMILGAKYKKEKKELVYKFESLEKEKLLIALPNDDQKKIILKKKNVKEKQLAKAEMVLMVETMDTKKEK